MKKILSLSIEIEALKIVPLKLPGILPENLKMGGEYRKEKLMYVKKCSRKEANMGGPDASQSLQEIRPGG